MTVKVQFQVEAVDSAAVAVEDLEVDLVEAMEVVPAAAAAVDSEAVSLSIIYFVLYLIFLMRLISIFMILLVPELLLMF